MAQEELRARVHGLEGPKVEATRQPQKLARFLTLPKLRQLSLTDSDAKMNANWEEEFMAVRKE